VANLGAGDVRQPFRVTFFEDRNGNNTFDAGTDNVLGSAMVTDPVVAEGRITVSANLSGYVLFTNNRIWAYADSGQVIDEADETNNLGVRLSEFIPLRASSIRS